MKETVIISVKVTATTSGRGSKCGDYYGNGTGCSMLPKMIWEHLFGENGSSPATDFSQSIPGDFRGVASPHANGNGCSFGVGTQ